MTAPFLAVDIGNSTVVLGIYDGERLAHEWRFPSERRLASRVVDTHLRLFAGETGIALRDIRGAGISSVVPPSTAIVARRLGALCGITPVVIAGSRGLPPRSSYRAPERLGADRICAVVAAMERYGSPSIIIDLGTATTIDVVKRGRRYAGGVIAPGFGLLAGALHARTAQLPEFPLEFPPSVIGTDTVSCMQSGVMFGGVASIEGLVERIRRQTGARTRIIVTGGYASLFASASSLRTTVDPSLVLDGIRIIAAPAMSSRSGRAR